MGWKTKIPSHLNLAWSYDGKKKMFSSRFLKALVWTYRATTCYLAPIILTCLDSGQCPVSTSVSSVTFFRPDFDSDFVANNSLFALRWISLFFAEFAISQIHTVLVLSPEFPISRISTTQMLNHRNPQFPDFHFPKSELPVSRFSFWHFGFG